MTENKVNIDSIEGSGKDGRVLKGDLIDLMGVNPSPSEEKLSMVKKKELK